MGNKMRLFYSQVDIHKYLRMFIVQSVNEEPRQKGKDTLLSPNSKILILKRGERWGEEKKKGEREEEKGKGYER